MEDFKKEVKQMRDAQKAYFKERTPENLQNAKFWERRVDVSLNQDQRPTLF